MSVASEARTRVGEGGRVRGFWGPIRREFGDPEKRTAYWMVLPTLIIVLVIAGWPILYAVYLSFLRTLPTSQTFVGLSNYAYMLSDPVFYSAVLNTSIFTIASVAVEFVLGLWIAVALNRGFRGQGAGRAIAITPWAFAPVVTGLFFRLMYQDQVGILSYLGQQVGLVSGSILAEDTSVLVGAIVADVWKTTPFVALLLLAGLQTIPGQVYEAARVDGASKLQQFTRITLPLLKPAILVALLFRTLDAWRVYDLFWAMSDRQLDSLSTYAFENVRISNVNFSVGNATSVFIFLSSLLIAFVFIKFLGTRAQED